MNKFKKYCPNVFCAECETEHKRGDIITLTTKYGKEVECEVYNFLFELNGKKYYSIVKLEDKSFVQRKIEKYEKSAENQEAISKMYYEKSQEGKEFLSLAEPIKIGHHSEKRHRALIDRNWNRMGKSVQAQNKAEEIKRKVEYWKSLEGTITLAMPESLEFFTQELEQAKATHQGLKDGTIKREHSYSLQYANKKVKDLTKQVEIARKLWEIKD